MDIFGIGIGELILILVVALIIGGPGRLPEIARTLGKTMRALKKVTFDLTAEVTKEIDEEENDHPTQPKQSSGMEPGNHQK